MNAVEAAVRVFDLRSPSRDRVAAFKAKTRWMLGGMVVFCLVLALAGLFEAFKEPDQGYPDLYYGLVIFAAFLWFALSTLSGLLYTGGPPPTALHLTLDGFELVYPSRLPRFAGNWNDPRLSLTLRDFTAQPPPVNEDLVLDTGERRISNWLYPSPVPGSGYLTPVAFQALREEAHRHGLREQSQVITHWRDAGGWNYLCTRVVISHMAP